MLELNINHSVKIGYNIIYHNSHPPISETKPTPLYSALTFVVKM